MKAEPVEYAAKEVKPLKAPIVRSIKTIQKLFEEKVILKKILDNCEEYESDLRSKALGIKDLENRIKKDFNESSNKNSNAKAKLEKILTRKPSLEGNSGSFHSVLDNSLINGKKKLVSLHRKNKSWNNDEETNLKSLNNQLHVKKEIANAYFQNYIRWKKVKSIYN